MTGHTGAFCAGRREHSAIVVAAAVHQGLACGQRESQHCPWDKRVGEASDITQSIQSSTKNEDSGGRECLSHDRSLDLWRKIQGPNGAKICLTLRHCYATLVVQDISRHVNTSIVYQVYLKRLV